MTAPLAALAFKLLSDPFIGHLTFLRVYSGVMTSGSSVLNATKGVKERIGRLLKMHANKREEIERGLCRGYRGPGGAQEHHHRRHPGG